MNEILIAIPTKNRSDILPLPLYSLSQQAIHFDLVIYDSSDAPVTDNYIVRQMIDLLQLHKGVDVKHIRSMKDRSLALARVFLLRYARERHYRYLLMLDDDVMLTPGFVKTLYDHIRSHSKVIYVAGVAIDVNNALAHSDYSLDTKNSFAGLSEWGIPHYYYNMEKHKEIKCVTGGFHYMIAMNRISPDKFTKVIYKLRHLHGMPCEDIMLEYWLTDSRLKGHLLTNALCYHFPSTAQPRDWYNVTRKLQTRISKTGEL